MLRTMAACLLAALALVAPSAGAQSDSSPVDPPDYTPELPDDTTIPELFPALVELYDHELYQADKTAYHAHLADILSQHAYPDGVVRLQPYKTPTTWMQYGWGFFRFKQYAHDQEIIHAEIAVTTDATGAIIIFEGAFIPATDIGYAVDPPSVALLHQVAAALGIDASRLQLESSTYLWQGEPGRAIPVHNYQVAASGDPEADYHENLAFVRSHAETGQIILRGVRYISFAPPDPAIQAEPDISRDIVWHPAMGLPVSAIVQIGSEVYLSVPINFYSYPCPLPTGPVTVLFPSLFVSGCAQTLPREPDMRISAFGSAPDSGGMYNYTLGNGWIRHSRAGVCSRPVDALGLLYMRNYPWVYGADWGWRYVVEEDSLAHVFIEPWQFGGGEEIAIRANGWWLYTPAGGWFWTARNIYPHIYRPGEGWAIMTND
jgi:hypothetical protein